MKLISLEKFPLPKHHGNRLSCLAPGRQLSRLEVLEHVCRVPGCRAIYRSHENMKTHYRMVHYRYNYLGMLVKEKLREARVKGKIKILKEEPIRKMNSITRSLSTSFKWSWRSKRRTDISNRKLKSQIDKVSAWLAKDFFHPEVCWNP